MAQSKNQSDKIPSITVEEVEMSGRETPNIPSIMIGDVNISDFEKNSEVVRNKSTSVPDHEDDNSSRSSLGSQVLPAITMKLDTQDGEVENSNNNSEKLSAPTIGKNNRSRSGSNNSNGSGFLHPNSFVSDLRRRSMDSIQRAAVWARDTGSKTLQRLRSFSQGSIEIDEDARFLQWMEQQFQDIAGEDKKIDRQEFGKALRVKQSFFAERFFSLFDTDGNGTIDLEEMMEGITMITRGSQAQKLKFLFEVYDVDGSGHIDFKELRTVLLSCMVESSLKLSDEDIDDLTWALLNDADQDRSGRITFDELEAELDKYPDVRDNLTMSAANWLKPPKAPVKKKRFTMPRYLTETYIRNNLRKVIFIIVYFLVNLGLFIFSAVKYRKSNWAVIIARGCGMTLNFNCVFVLVLMCRYCLTWLRTTKLGQYLPMDQSILFHKLVGLTIFGESVVHTIAHLVNIQYVVDDQTATNGPLNNVTYAEFLFTLKSDIGWLIPGFAYLSGDLLIIILTIMVICSMPFVRRSGYFQVFYWTHTLYILFWILLILHGPIFWCFFIVPGFVFIVERVYMSKAFKLAKYGHVYIEEINLLPSKVTHLVIGRPEVFHFKPGDYIFINIPAIAKHEWHPFTISSCPENKREIWLHIRTAGHWTGKLYDFFNTYEQTEQQYILESGYVNRAFIRQESMKEIINTTLPANGADHEGVEGKGRRKGDSLKTRALKTLHTRVEVYIDGPFGTGTREVLFTEHAVLIGSGIGVTPFASILQSVWKRYQQSKHTCPNCSSQWYGDIPESLMNLKKVDFIWINRDQKSFEWFVGLIARLECEKAEAGSFEEFLEMQMYMTSALDKADMKALGLQMALEILHKNENVDKVTGLKTRTHAGRPNWDEIFSNIAKNKKGPVKVFFCGAPLLSKVLKSKCVQYGFHFAKENF